MFFQNSTEKGNFVKTEESPQFNFFVLVSEATNRKSQKRNLSDTNWMSEEERKRLRKRVNGRIQTLRQYIAEASLEKKLRQRFNYEKKSIPKEKCDNRYCEEKVFVKGLLCDVCSNFDLKGPPSKRPKLLAEMKEKVEHFM